MSKMPTNDEFPTEVGELLNMMSKLAIDVDLAERVIEDAFHNELMYRFGHRPNSTILRNEMKLVIQTWCDIIYAMTGRKIDLEDFTLE